MKYAGIIGMVAGGVLLAGSALTVQTRVRASAKRLRTGEVLSSRPGIATADDAEAAYCTPEFKKVLARVIHACGLAGSGGRRGCKPADVKSLASISDDDFNALFTPLKQRGAVIMFDDNSDKLDEPGKKIIEDRWLDRKGARYFFVVARASKTGGADYNRKLSHKRANSVLFYLSDRFNDKELNKKVGLLWLGEEFAQLGKEYCEWPVSRPKGCESQAINRSAFISWVDCQL
jgi:outer membrane protein OmpA-like peptidoglycan-associated protein